MAILALVGMVGLLLRLLVATITQSIGAASTAIIHRHYGCITPQIAKSVLGHTKIDGAREEESYEYEKTQMSPAA